MRNYYDFIQYADMFVAFKYVRLIYLFAYALLSFAIEELFEHCEFVFNYHEIYG